MNEASIPGRRLVLEVNGESRSVDIEDRQLLVEVIRGQLGLTGTHIGCLNGDCGACTVRIDGRITKSCLVMAASVDGAGIETIEGVQDADGELTDLQQGLWENDAFQCGFCVPGHLFAMADLLENEPAPDAQDVRDCLIGNICRCTGYTNFVKAGLAVAAARRQTGGVVSVARPCPRAVRLHHDGESLS